MRKLELFRKRPMTILACGGVLAAIVTGCSPSTVKPLGGNNTAAASVQQSVNPTSSAPSSWSPLETAVGLGLKSHAYQEKVTVNITQKSALDGFMVYGRLNPPHKYSVAFHQNGYNMAFYQQKLSAYGEQDGHWQQMAALTNLSLFPSYKTLVDNALKANVPIQALQPAQYVVDEYCDVYQAIIPASVIGTLPEFGAFYHPGNMSSVVYTFYVGQKSGQLRQVVTSSQGSITDIGSVGIQSDTILFAINQTGSQITIDPNLYNSLLYQY